MELAYGKGFLKVELPNYSKVHIHEPKELPTVSKQQLSIGEILDGIGLASNFRKRDNYLIILDHPERCSGYGYILDELLYHLEANSTHIDHFKILISTDRERDPRVQNCLDVCVSHGVPYEFHRDSDKSRIASLGATPTYGTRISLNRTYLESANPIVVSALTPNLFYGSTGGPNAIFPGLASKESRIENEALLSKDDFGIHDFTSASCIDINEGYQLKPASFGLHFVPDNQGNIIAFNAGDFYSSWKKSLEYAELSITRIDFSPYDFVISSAGGDTWDATLFDAISGLINAARITRVGGTILYVAECQEGVGPDGFLHGLAYANNPEQTNGYPLQRDIGTTQALLLRKALRTKKLILCSRIRESLVEEKMGFTPVQNPQEGIELVLKSLISDAKIGYVVNSSMVDV